MLEKEVIAHRGVNRCAPENTMKAFLKAYEYGLKWIELDVDILGDGTPIVIHDSTLDRTTDHSGSYYSLGEESLKNIDAGSWFGAEYADERIPTLRQVIDFLNETGMHANIELKGNEQGAEGAHRLIRRVAEELERLDAKSQIIISSFNHLILAEFKKYAPQWTVACLWEDCALYEDWKTIMELVGAEYIHPEDKNLSREKVQAFKAAGYGVNVWTVNDKARINELFNWGVNGVFTDISHEL